ncbi:MAG: hypothetical protein HGA90_07885, partial [Alphaproteobacteria bacterium]|nr:hypothetical protein [Alphaproteobacteria bacterium]
VRTVDTGVLECQPAERRRLVITQDQTAYKREKCIDPGVRAFAKAGGDLAPVEAAYERLAYRSSIEALARRAVKGGSPITNIPAVDIYNAVSLASLAPLGAYDVARLPQGDMTMRRVDPAQDSFAPLGGKELDFPLHQGLVVYATGAKVLCWGFNCRDASDTCLTAETDDGVFFGEAVFPAHHAALHEAFAKLKALLTEAGAACGDVKLASASCPSFAL